MELWRLLAASTLPAIKNRRKAKRGFHPLKENMEYSKENGRIVNPFDMTERPTFLPGDKVSDKRDAGGRIWRIVRRTAFWNTELMTLREVGDDTNERTMMANQLIPYLKMVAMSK
jgi:hypothetical protein